MDKPASVTPVDSERQIVSVTDTREIPDYYQHHIEDLHKTILELKSASEKNNKKHERIISRLRFRLSLFSFFWFLTVLILSGVSGWFGFRWYNQMQLQKQLATFSPEKVQEVEKIRDEIKEFSQTLPQLQTEIKANQEEIDKSQQSMSVLVKAMQELINGDSENQSLEVKPDSTAPN